MLVIPGGSQESPEALYSSLRSDTSLARDRAPPPRIGKLAQWSEHPAHTGLVLGSSPRFPNASHILN